MPRREGQRTGKLVAGPFAGNPLTGGSMRHPLPIGLLALLTGPSVLMSLAGVNGLLAEKGLGPC